MTELWSGNEAAARGIYEAGAKVASAYPGTPSTEIIEQLASYDGIYAEWAPNEKVAFEVAYGAAIAGVRAVAAMKHVGLNVAADPLFTASYSGVNGGFVIISADDPSMHSSQNEQDNRHYAKAAKVPMFEPADGQECLNMMVEAFDVSERFDTPVLFRMTTRVCHSKSVVSPKTPSPPEPKPYIKNARKYIMAPANAYVRRPFVEQRMAELANYSESCRFNRIEKKGNKIGVLTSGVAAAYAKEIFPEDTSFLKLGFSYPLPKQLISDFAESVETLYVIEEGDSFLEDGVRALGIDCIGKEKVPSIYELNPQILKQALFPDEEKQPPVSFDDKVVPRPPALCPGCPHRGLFFTLKKYKNAIIAGDIGCYTLGASPPLAAMDCMTCMGGGFTLAAGMSKAFAQKGTEQLIFGVVGDSTFFHSGMTGAAEIIYNEANVIPVVLDNSITAMTGQQDHPGSGKKLTGEPANVISIETVLEAIGFKTVITADPQDLEAMKKACDEAVASTVPAAIVARRPCLLIKGLDREKRKCSVDREKCKSCKRCLSVACPAVFFVDGRSYIDQELCTGCTVCLQVCPFDAISLEEEVKV